MKKLLPLLLFLFLFCISTPAQQSFEKLCPPGMSPLPGGQTYDGITQKYRQWLCVDAFGNVSSIPDFGFSTSVADPTLFGAKADTQFVTDATWNIGSGNVSSASGRFTVFDNFKQCTGIDGGAGQATLPVGLFTFLTSTNGACSVNATASKTNGTFVWGTNDQAAMDSAYNQLITKTPCGGTLELPAGIIWMTANPQKAATPAFCGQFDSSFPHIKVVGQGHSSSVLFFAPNFNTGNTAGGCVFLLSCFFGGDFEDHEDYGIIGLGFKNFTISSPASILKCGNACSAKFLQISALGSGVANLAGISITGQSAVCHGCYVDGAGAGGSGIVVSGLGPIGTISSFTNQGYQCTTGTVCYDIGSTLNANSFTNVHGVNVGGTLTITGTEINENNTFCALAISNSAAIVNSIGSTWINANAGGGGACFTSNGGTLNLSSSSVTNSNAAITSQAHTGNVVNDNGGNTVTGPVSAYLGTWNFRNSSGIPAALGNCSSSASPAVCASAPSGSVVIAAAATTVTVNTTSVTANSQIFISEDDTLGTKLGVTCNTTLAARTYEISARTAGTSFQITSSAAPVTNPACLSYTIIN